MVGISTEGGRKMSGFCPGVLIWVPDTQKGYNPARAEREDDGMLVYSVCNVTQPSLYEFTKILFYFDKIKPDHLVLLIFIRTK